MSESPNSAGADSSSYFASHHPRKKRRIRRTAQRTAAVTSETVPRLKRRTLTLLLIGMAWLGLWGGWSVERTIYGPVRVQVEGVMSTRPNLQKGPIMIYTPTPGLR